MKSDYNIIQALSDSAMFGPWFQGESWNAWKVFLKALFGLKLTEAELDFYQQCTGRENAPTAAFSECWVVSGQAGR